MYELDEWTNAIIISPLYAAFAKDSESAYVDAVATIKKAIREKVLESYHNGQKAGLGRKKMYARGAIYVLPVSTIYSCAFQDKKYSQIRVSRHLLYVLL